MTKIVHIIRINRTDLRRCRVQICSVLLCVLEQQQKVDDSSSGFLNRGAPLGRHGRIGLRPILNIDIDYPVTNGLRHFPTEIVTF